MIWFSFGREMNCLSVLRSVGRHQLTILTIKINLNRIGKKVVPFRSFFLFSFFCYFFFSWIFDSVGPALQIGFSWNELFLCNCQMALPAKIIIVSWNLNNTTLFLLLLIFFLVKLCSQKTENVTRSRTDENYCDREHQEMWALAKKLISNEYSPRFTEWIVSK